MREQEASRDPLVPSVFRYVALCLCPLSFHLLRTSFSAGCKTEQNVGTGLTLRLFFLYVYLSCNFFLPVDIHFSGAVSAPVSVFGVYLPRL